MSHTAILHIAIVDDEHIQLNLMQRIINKIASTNDFHVQLYLFESGEAFLFELEDLPSLDLVFLDIQMKQLDGMQVAQKIRSFNQTVSLIFVTAFAEYAIEGYQVAALDYILKPIDDKQIERVFNKYLQILPKESKYLLVNNQNNIIKINENDIIYIEADKHQVIIHTISDLLVINKRISVIKEELSDAFISPHRSYLVNLMHIEQLENSEILLSNGTSIPMSRRLVKSVQASFVNYYKKDVFYE